MCLDCVCVWGGPPAVGRGDQVGGGEEPVEQVQTGSLLPSDQGLTLALLPAVTVGCGGGPLQPEGGGGGGTGDRN